MDIGNVKYFKYEIALGQAVPMPAPKIDVFPDNQFSVQQFLHAVCKEHIGALGKTKGKWEFGGEWAGKVKLSTRTDITQIFDFCEELKIIEPKPSEDGGGELTVYQLSKAYWTKFDSFAQ